MIISDAEIRRCIDNIDSSGSRGKYGHLLPSRSERDTADAYRRSMDKLPQRLNSRLNGVKKAFDSSAYNVSGIEVAEKLLGRVISDKLR
jgi:hypothetical protein